MFLESLKRPVKRSLKGPVKGPTGVDERVLTVEGARQLLESVRLPSGYSGKIRTGCRAVHTNGVFVSGVFRPNEHASRLSSSALFSDASDGVEFIARFSPLLSRPKDLHGLAIKLPFDTETITAGKGTTDFVAMNLDEFMFLSGNDFGQFLRDLRQRRHLWAWGRFTLQSLARRASWRALARAAWAMRDTRTPILQHRYHGLHTFFTVAGTDNEKPVRKPVRYMLEPVVGDSGRSQKGRVGARRYLDLRGSIEGADATTFTLVFLLPRRSPLLPIPETWRSYGPWDKLTPAVRARLINPMHRWRRPERVVMGILEITEVLDDAAFKECTTREEYDRLLFDPTNLADGIETSDDQLLACRAGVYTESHMRRVGCQD